MRFLIGWVLIRQYTARKCYVVFETVHFSIALLSVENQQIEIAIILLLLYIPVHLDYPVLYEGESNINRNLFSEVNFFIPSHTEVFIAVSYEFLFQGT